MLLTAASAFSMAGIAADYTNIVLINLDDVGYGDFSFNGAYGYTTPNIDKMAAEGVRFTHFLVGQPISGASRAGLLTGCYPNMGQIQEERLILILLDEINRTGGIIRSQPCLVRIITDNLISVISRQIREIKDLTLLRVEWPHIVRIRQPIILIEAILQGEELLLAT